MNPTKLGSIDNHDQERWKTPLPQFIEHLYLERFGRERPAVVVSIEQRGRQVEKKKAERKAARAARRPPATARPDQLRREASAWLRALAASGEDERQGLSRGEASVWGVDDLAAIDRKLDVARERDDNRARVRLISRALALPEAQPFLAGYLDELAYALGG